MWGTPQTSLPPQWRARNGSDVEGARHDGNHPKRLVDHAVRGRWKLFPAACGLMFTVVLPGQVGGMKAHFFRSVRIAVFFGMCVGAVVAADAQAPPSQVPALLPAQFAGWQIEGSAATSKDATTADPANASVLREYRFTDFASATYKRDDGRTLKIRAARFEDASGAFGAYTFYLQPEMSREKIGDEGASLGQRVVFYRGHILVDALFSQESAMSGAELRDLAGALPRPGGSAGAMPPVLNYMPQRGYVRNTQKYVEGPLALASLAPPISTELVDFPASAEVTTGRYNTAGGEASLMLIYYTNPQVAIEHIKRMDAAFQQAQAPAGVSAVRRAGSFSYSRTGPIIAIASGPISASDAASLLGRVNYEASVTWNEATDQHDVHDLYMLVLNVVILCAILGGLAVVAGVAFGGFRILMKRWFPDKVFDRPEQMEFISLHLTETIVQGVSRSGTEEGQRPQSDPFESR